MELNIIEIEATWIQNYTPSMINYEVCAHESLIGWDILRLFKT